MQTSDMIVCEKGCKYSELEERKLQYFIVNDCSFTHVEESDLQACRICGISSIISRLWQCYKPIIFGSRAFEYKKEKIRIHFFC